MNEKAAPSTDDVLYVNGPSETSGGVQVIRKRGESIELGELRPIREGKPILGELVRLRPREESGRLFDVDVVAKGTASTVPTLASEGGASDRSLRKGPARVSTEGYRENWDIIFGTSKKTLN